ncbi:MAG: prepilin peptidase [Candidatus Omnitrophota bacterium]
MLIFFSIILGLIIGSFLNVCIYRMPKSKSVVRPRSHCPSCEKIISWYDNIPVLSFILLGGKCRFCKAKISIRYAVVEILTALVFVFLIKTLGFNFTTIIYIAVSCGMIVATFIDFDHQIIPDEITIGGMIAGLILSFIYPQLHFTASRFHGLLYSMAGLLTGGSMIYLIGILGKFLFKKDAMGGGDVKYLAMMGSFIGFKGAILIFFVAPFFGAIVGIFMKIKYKAEIIPYGPYLSIAALLVMVWGDRILQLLFPYLA